MNTDFKLVLSQIEPIISSGADLNKILIDICSILKEKIYHYDWVGFYTHDPETNMLILGPHAGKPTEHLRIPVGKGVCGQVAANKKLKVVQDVKNEDNYISCSIDVQSEIVVPVLKNGNFMAVLDIDSHSPAPFSTEDEDFLTTICNKVSPLFGIPHL